MVLIYVHPSTTTAHRPRSQSRVILPILETVGNGASVSGGIWRFHPNLPRLREHLGREDGEQGRDGAWGRGL